ncbi:MAG: hypothetical protein WCZ01_05285 [Candidatus Neomarinimicrobiota bacterium]|jgi:hypothetical protein|nr:hypothetical protein [Candidatus Neomarinimicrobiota bacterium]HPB00271.1 hypothetical protein [Candidatus Neomarinimicrobiota bacterium]HPY00179.1 hypothetical protein [Candidatus Neomarinimicrobiota bacterium]HQC62158.1 hypothetical protein [Candidatus Neomarinimicrobiota bacterium]HQM36324.1 hypothetical protein [Candidatus Neomarinimicrobiota bacterium]
MKYCDLSCEYAEFPDKLSDGSATCQTFIAIHCKLLDRLVDKNGICPAEQSATDKSVNKGR